MDPLDRARQVQLVAFDFDGVFTDNGVYVSEHGQEWVRCCRSDGLGLRKLDAIGVGYLILSTEENPVVSVRARKLRIECRQGVADKRVELERLATGRGIDLSKVAYVGNDINDLGCLQCVGFPVAVADAHPDILASGVYRTRARGGYGAVREVCDLLERAHVAQ